MFLETQIARPIKADESARIAREFYGLATTAKSLPGEYDSNFHLTASNGREFVLKVMHPARERSFIEMQCATLIHLEQNAPQLDLPRVVRNLKSELFAPYVAPDGTTRLVWLLSFISGTVLADVRPHAPELLSDLGRFLGELDRALQSFSHPAAQRELKWDSSRTLWIKDRLHYIEISQRRALVEKFVALFESEVAPSLLKLRRSVIYGDANDYNVLVSPAWPQPRKILGVIDFGDMHHGLTVSELAIAVAYSMLGKENPLAAASSLVAGYHDAFPLRDEEFAVLFPLVCARLAVSVTNSACRKALKPDDPYVTISEAPAWEALERLSQIHPRFAHFAFRAAAGLTASPFAEKFARWLSENGKSAASVLDADLKSAPVTVFDLSVGSTFLGADPSNSQVHALSDKIDRKIKSTGARVGIGRYDEPRLLYSSPLFSPNDQPTAERRTVHLGIDLFVAAGSPVRAPFSGVVHALANNIAKLDYGPVVILRHDIPQLGTFFTLYGHLARKTLESLKVGDRIERGKQFASIGTVEENGGWPPHLHFQVITDLLDLGTNFPGVAFASERQIWTNISLDPNLILQITANRFPPNTPDTQQTLATRKSLLGGSLSISYQKPLKIVRGWKQYLYDDTGRAYLDVYNNVPLVGHSHPRVVMAAQNQLALLNTNTRYLHDNVNRYAERLTSLLPSPLKVCFFVNSGSEANELALRLARTHTGHEDIIVLEHAYHGHTNSLIDISPYKFDGPGGHGKKPWVHVAPLADDYRGRYRRGDGEAGRKYAAHVKDILESVQKEGRGVAGYIAETLPSVGGQIVFPPDYLAEVYRHVRSAGAVCIADEVQVGFGRLGTHFWGFETQGVVPDIVVFGKPIGNAFPLAAVVTTPEIANSFNNGMEFFSTFGGNPVASAVGLAVLDVLEEEKLQQHALKTGNYLLDGLRGLQEKYSLVGDVRGSGLFLGLDLVLDRESREPAPHQASYVVNRLRDCGILAGTDGPHHNVIKLRPPLVFTNSNADFFVQTLDTILQEDPAQSRTSQS
jgi:4-aminobutyrate aminotransferase-like enzyme/Ser/Thr protein kinase RdoA (MazF antagonist)